MKSVSVFKNPIRFGFQGRAGSDKKKSLVFEKVVFHSRKNQRRIWIFEYTRKISNVIAHPNLLKVIFCRSVLRILFERVQKIQNKVLKLPGIDRV